MSYITKRLALGVLIKGKPPPFVDFVPVVAQGGTGATGTNLSPGGNGGSVVLEVNKGTKCLKHIPDKVVGRNAAPVKPGWISARHPKNTRVTVPRGTQVIGEDETVLATLNEEKDKFVLAEGGRGGDPVVSRIQGERGQRVKLYLELKSIADVGLVGFPNAGKSSLLSKVSSAHPKIGAYPFTTLRPSVGYLKKDLATQYKSGVTMADIPGIIEGAHDNVGLGSIFLRHIERTSLLLYVIDVQGFQLRNDKPYRTAVETYEHLVDELELYMPQLSERPSIICLNKIDLDHSGSLQRDTLAQLRDLASDDTDIMPASTVTGEGLEDLTKRIKERVYELNPAKAPMDANPTDGGDVERLNMG